MISKNLTLLFSIIANIFVSSRPTTWIRIFAEMFLGFALANGHTPLHVLMFLVGFIAVGPLMLTATYILNDITDIKYDLQHNLKKLRPITQGVLPKKTAIRIILVLILLSILLGYAISPKFCIGLLTLIISQLFYTMKPFRWKEKFILDLIPNGINGGVRFTLGYFTVNDSFVNFPFFFLLFVICSKIILFIGHRMQSRTLEIKNNFKSTTASLSVSQIKVVVFSVSLLTGSLYLFSIVHYSLGILMLLPPLIFLIMLTPIFFVIKKGYLSSQEQGIKWRVYIYIIFLIFSIMVFVSIKSNSII